MESYLSEFYLLAMAHLVAVASPGPDFAIILRQSVTHGRATAIWTSLGIGAGIFMHVAYTIMGVGFIVAQSHYLFQMIKYAGAFYLIFIGVGALRAQRTSVRIEKSEQNRLETSARRAFQMGFLTNALNPKATLFFLSLFSVIVSSTTPTVVQMAYGCYMALFTALWFTLLSLLLGHDYVRQGFRRFGHWFERVTGGVLLMLGLGLAFVDSK